MADVHSAKIYQPGRQSDRRERCRLDRHKRLFNQWLLAAKCGNELRIDRANRLFEAG